MPQVEIPLLLYTVRQTAQALGVHHATVRRLINQGDLPHRMVGRIIKIPRAAVEAFVRKSHPRGSR